MSSVAILGYWDIRGLAEPIRLVLEHAGVDYEDRRMNMTKPGWLEYKAGLGFDFPNLPYYEEPGGLRLTQSGAILRHLGRRHGLEASTAEELARTDMLADTIGDHRAALVQLCYNPEFSPAMLAAFQGPLAERMAALEAFLGRSAGDWCTGAQLTWVDFLAWEYLAQARALVPGCLEASPRVARFLARFAELPNIAAYLGRPTYRAFPIWSLRAKYGYRPTA